jgi:hypothetical protein
VRRSGPPARRTPLAPGGPLLRVAWPIRDSRIANHVPPAKPRRPADTGPPERTRKLVRARSGGRCEWPDCFDLARHMHHRLNRKDGGRHGAMRERLNGAAWLAHCCPMHHALVTDPVGVERAYAEASGWLLREGMDARTVPILTGHSVHLVLFDNAGDWELAA